MLVALSDTHGRDDARLSGRTADALDDAAAVVHTGDFVTGTVLDIFDSCDPLYAVYGNRDSSAVRERLPAEQVFEWRGLRIAAVHGHEHTEIELSMLGRESDADLVVFGHSHRPEFRDGVVPALNPGSHADPRWNRPAHAELEWDGTAGIARGRLVEPSGTVFERFTVEPRE